MERLTSVIEEYNSMDGLQMKHAMDEDRTKSIYNIIAGTTSESQVEGMCILCRAVPFPEMASGFEAQGVP